MASFEAQITNVSHRFLHVNGIRMHIAEQGEGPLVVLAHGFPELWYSWRHVLPALAAAGYHAVAPDMRGYGQTDAPPEIKDYARPQAVADMVCLVRALGYEEAVIGGHDQGAGLAFDAANLRPDVFRAVILLSVPYVVLGEIKPTDVMRRVPDGKQLYQWYFQQPGVAEEELEGDPKRSLRMVLYSTSGSIPKEHKVRYIFGLDEKFLDGCTDPGHLPEWLKPEDLDYYASEFSRTGFRGGLNYYRVADISWRETFFLLGRKLLQPTLYVVGADDLAYELARPMVDQMDKTVPNLWKMVVLPGVGHWTQQEAPEDVNRLMVEFMHSVDSKAAAK